VAAALLSTVSNLPGAAVQGGAEQLMLGKRGAERCLMLCEVSGVGRVAVKQNQF
jgi:hypothetical protein